MTSPKEKIEALAADFRAARPTIDNAKDKAATDAAEHAEQQHRADSKKALALGRGIVDLLSSSSLHCIPLYLSRPLDTITSLEEQSNPRAKKIGDSVVRYCEEGYIWPLYPDTRKELTGKHDHHFSSNPMQLSLSNHGHLFIGEGRAPLEQKRAITDRSGGIHDMFQWTAGAFDLEIIPPRAAISLVEDERFQENIGSLLAGLNTQTDTFTDRQKSQLARKTRRDNLQGPARANLRNLQE